MNINLLSTFLIRTILFSILPPLPLSSDYICPQNLHWWVPEVSIPSTPDSFVTHQPWASQPGLKGKYERSYGSGGCTQGCTKVHYWLWNGWVVPHSLCLCIVRHWRVCKGEGVSQLIHEVACSILSYLVPTCTILAAPFPFSLPYVLIFLYPLLLCLCLLFALVLPPISFSIHPPVSLPIVLFSVSPLPTPSLLLLSFLLLNLLSQY